MLVFGQSEFILRFIPALLGVLTIPVFYYIGKEFADEDVGIIMAALLPFPRSMYFILKMHEHTQRCSSYSHWHFFFFLRLPHQ